MTETRYTPEELADEYPGDGWERRRFLERLTDAGYVIVHPDDVKRAAMPDVHMSSEHERGRLIGLTEGWNSCYERIFGSSP